MKLTGNKKAQASLEATIILLFILIIVKVIWLGGPFQQSTEKSTDTNGIILGSLALDEIADTVEVVGISGLGTKKDFVIHVPFNTVDMRYGDGNYLYHGDLMNGPHMNMTILLYSNISENGFSLYSVDAQGRPYWYGNRGPFKTSYYYKTLTVALKYPLNELYFPLCDNEARKNSSIMRGPATRLIFIDDHEGNQPSEQKDITFCCEAGFNLHLYMEKSLADARKIAIRSRHYYSLPVEWIVRPFGDEEA